MRVPGSFSSFAFDHATGEIAWINGAEVKSTGFRAAVVELPIVNVNNSPQVICLALTQVAQAAKDWKLAYPNGRIEIVSHQVIENGDPALKISGGGPVWSDEWIVVTVPSGRVAVSPLAIRLLTFQKKSLRDAFEHELQTAGVLADVL